MLLMLSLWACDDHIFTGGSGHGGHSEGSDAVAILKNECSGCHSDSLLPDFSGDICENLIDVQATQVAMPFITVGDPSNSYLYIKMIGTAADVGGVDSPMPPTGMLAGSDIEVVEQWILDGASCDEVVDTGDPEDTGVPDDTGGPDTDQPGDMDQSIPIDGDATNGNTLVNSQCMGCHSNAFQFDDLIPRIDNPQIYRAIEEGKGVSMPAFPNLTDQELDDIVAFLRTTYPAEPNGEDTGNGGNNGGNFDGEQIAASNCDGCHVNGYPYTPTYESIIPNYDAQQLEDIIRNGTSGGMPAFPNFSQGEMDALILFLADTYN